MSLPREGPASPYVTLVLVHWVPPSPKRGGHLVAHGLFIGQWSVAVIILLKLRRAHAPTLWLCRAFSVALCLWFGPWGASTPLALVLTIAVAFQPSFGGARGACKSGCKSKGGKPKLSQPNCRGLCIRCFKAKFPEEYARPRRVDEAGCAMCAAARPQSTDVATGLRYCRICFAKQCPQLAAAANLRRSNASASVEPSAVADDSVCYYCRSADADVASRQCTYAGGACAQQVAVCDRCSHVNGAVVCSVCYGRCWRQRCFACRAPPKVAKAGESRYCEDCDASGASSGRCYFCWAAGDDVQSRTCTYGSPDCQLEVLLCRC